MPVVNSRYRTEIDFRQARGHVNSDILYTTLLYYKSAGNTKSYASKIIIDAYSSYDPSEPPEITEIIDEASRAEYFFSKYEIERRKDIIRVLREEPVDEKIVLMEPKKMFVSFPLDEEKSKELIRSLEMIRYWDRGIIINRFLNQYFVHDRNEYYHEICANLLLRWMKNEYAAEGMAISDSLGRIIDILCRFNGIDGNKENEEESLSPALPAEDGEKSNDKGEREKKLRKLMGI